LLVAFAVRRAIERGQPLGYLETSMRIRFGESQPKAVDQIVAAAQKPVTLAQLSEEFTTIAPRLTGGPANEHVGLDDATGRRPVRRSPRRHALTRT
jgi:hypothetical protein